MTFQSPITRMTEFITQSFPNRTSIEQIQKDLLAWFQKSNEGGRYKSREFDIRGELYRYVISFGSLYTDGHKAKVEFVHASMEYAFLGYPEENIMF